jgi:phage protein D
VNLQSPLAGLSPHVPVPAYQVIVNGTDITRTLKPRLISLTITDNRGFEADTVELVLDDTDGKLALPKRGVAMQVWLGWQGQPLTDQGSYTIDEIEHAGAPDTLTLTGRSVDFRETMNIRQERSFHGKTVGEIVRTIAKANHLTPAIGTTIEHELIAHIDQSQESDASFLVRLAKQFDCIPTVKHGRLLFIPAGQGKTATGKAMPAVVISRKSGDHHRFAIADRDAYTGVIAYWHDPKQATKQQATVKRKRKTRKTTETATPASSTIPTTQKENELLLGSDTNVKTLRHIYASQKNAERAANAEWQRLQRGAAEFAIELATGRPELRTEMPVTVQGFKAEIDATGWLIIRVAHRVSDSGYTSQLELECHQNI